MTDTEPLSSMRVDPSMLAKVTFTEDDLATLHDLAVARRAVHRGNGDVEANQFDGSRLRAEVNGWMGEWAVADALGIPRSYDASGIADGGCDIDLGHIRVDVKFTPNRTGRLMVPVNQATRSDCMVLVVGHTRHEVYVVGGVLTEDFHERKHHWDWGYGPTQYLVQHELVLWENLLPYLRSGIT